MRVPFRVGVERRPAPPGVEDVIQLLTLLCLQQLGEELSPAAAAQRV
jgi:hypothetical protein